MATQIERATRTLFDENELHVRDVKLFPGNNRDATPEQMAEQVQRAIDQLLAGDYEEQTFTNH